MKKVFVVCLLCTLFLICLLPTPAFAIYGASAKLSQPLQPVKGALGYANERHEYIYIYAYQEEADIAVLFGAGNDFDFNSTYSPAPIFIVFSGIYTANISGIDTLGLPYYTLKDPLITATYATQLADMRSRLTKSDLSTACAIIVPQEQAEAWSGSRQYFSFVAHYGGGSSLGFADSIGRGVYAASQSSGATSTQEGTYMLVEPTLGLSVSKKILDNGSPVDKKEVQVGDEVSYKITIKNTSEIWLEGLVLRDDLFGANIADLKINGTPAALESDNTLILGNQKGTKTMLSGSGKDIVVTYTYTVVTEDIIIQNGKAAIPNEATVSATTPKKSYSMTADSSGAYPYVGPDLSVVKSISGNDACLLTLGDAEPELAIQKTISPTTASVGGSVSFHIKITNNSPFGVQNILVEDTLSPTAGDFINGQSAIGFLAAGESKILTYPYIVIESDVQDGQIKNTATASLGGYSVSSTVTLLVSEQPSPSPSESVSPSPEPTPSYTASAEPSSSGSNGPGTGDGENIWDYLVLCILCFIAIGVIYYLLRRSKKQ